jgi:hypothetical protein
VPEPVTADLAPTDQARFGGLLTARVGVEEGNSGSGLFDAQLRLAGIIVNRIDARRALAVPAAWIKPAVDLRRRAAGVADVPQAASRSSSALAPTSAATGRRAGAHPSAPRLGQHGQLGRHGRLRPRAEPRQCVRGGSWPHRPRGTLGRQQTQQFRFSNPNGRRDPLTFVVHSGGSKTAFEAC